MTSYYIYDYTTLLERVLSTGHEYHYSTLMVERSIAYSPYFQAVEKDKDTLPPIINEMDLIRYIYNNPHIDVEKTPIYNQCLWAAESYLRIQEASKLSFEAIFLYIPLKKMYDYFPIYHEMDFSQIINEFLSLYSKQSILGILLDNYHCSLKSVSETVNIPYNTLYSYKQRRRDIKKLNAKDALNLANLFKVRIETLLELKL